MSATSVRTLIRIETILAYYPFKKQHIKSLATGQKSIITYAETYIESIKKLIFYLFEGQILNTTSGYKKKQYK